MAFKEELQKELQDRFSPELKDALNALHTAVFGKPKAETPEEDA
jgi:hypothetical protein